MPTKVTTRYPHEPDYAVPPGETLAETVAALHMDSETWQFVPGFRRSTSARSSRSCRHHAGDRCQAGAGDRRPCPNVEHLEAPIRSARARIAERERLKHDLVWLKTIPSANWFGED